MPAGLAAVGENWILVLSGAAEAGLALFDEGGRALGKVGTAGKAGIDVPLQVERGVEGRGKAVRDRRADLGEGRNGSARQPPGKAKSLFIERYSTLAKGL